MSSLNLSGRMHEEQVAELQRVFGLGVRNQNLILDLKEVTLVGRDAMISLAWREGAGTRLRNCPRYDREWIMRERAGIRRPGSS